MRVDVWQIERDPGYLAWLSGIQARHPRAPETGRPSKLPPGASAVGRSLVLAEAGEGGGLRLGVRLSTGDTFWKEWEGRFEALLAQEVAVGALRSDRGHAQAGADLDEFLDANGRDGLRLEFCSSHAGGYTRAIAANGSAAYIDLD